MQVIYISASRRHGISAKTGNSYDLCKLCYGVPMESKKTESYDFIGHGLNTQEIDLDPTSLSDFVDCVPGTPISVSIAPQPSNLTKTWVNGLA